MVTKRDLPSYDKYFPFVAEALKRRGGSATIEEIEEDVAQLMKLPEEILAIPHKNSSRSQFAYELAWVRTYLKKAGMAENSARGVWALTEQGEKATPEELRLIPKKIRWEKKRKERDPELDLAAALELDWQERTLAALDESRRF
jgi:restriction system protein